MMTHLFISESGCYILEWVEADFFVVEMCQVVGVAGVNLTREQALAWALTFWSQNYPNIHPRIIGIYSREEYSD